MTVKRLKEILEKYDDELEIILEVADTLSDGTPSEKDELVDHIEANDTELYLVGDSLSDQVRLDKI